MAEDLDKLKKKTLDKLLAARKHLGKVSLEANKKGMFTQGEEVAEEEFEKALKIKPTDGEINYRLGMLQAKKGLISKALGHLQKVLVYSKDILKYKSMLQLAKIHYVKKSYNLADTYAKRAVELYPDKGEGYYVRSIVLHKVGKIEEAKKMAELAVKLGSKAAKRSKRRAN